MTIEDIYSIAPHWESIVNSKVKDFINLEKDMSNLSVELHNATWCPDCERESTSLFALTVSLAEKAPNMSIIGYEDYNDYKSKKASDSLDISCLPTIIFKDRDLNTVLTIKESSNPSFRELIESI